jgi:hypothetical protein
MEKARDKFDTIFVEEKLDGSCCSVAKIHGKIHALSRKGYYAWTSPFELHHRFADYVAAREKIFDEFIEEGEHCIGEWLAQAHGTRYHLTHEPFVLFDIARKDNIYNGMRRVTRDEFRLRCKALDLITPREISSGPPMSVEAMLKVLEPSGHGAEIVEGAVWRVEREHTVDFLGKYVRPEFMPGSLLPEVIKRKQGPHHPEPTAIWNWTEEL